MFDFPNSPTTGTIIAGPGGIQYRYDGTKWTAYTTGVSYAPLASPIFTGDPQAPTPTATDNDTSIATTAWGLPRVGVTDGSNAAAGQVGEVIQVTRNQASAVTLASGSDYGMLNIVLTPGDWELTGEIWFNTNTNTNNCAFSASISQSGSTPGDVFATGATRVNLGTGNANMYPPILAPAPLRVNVSTNYTVYLVAWATFSGMTVTAYGRLQARRMR
jgi:hypothetical protein